MHVVIMGCGRVGSTLAHSLEQRGHSVSVIDVNPDAFRRLGGEFSGHTVTGSASTGDVLIDAGIERADAFAAVSSGDNSNIISARVARETFGVQRVVARIYDSKRAEVYERLGIPTVATVRWTADRMLRHLVPEASDRGLARPDVARSRCSRCPCTGAGSAGRVQAIEEASGARVAYLMRFGLGSCRPRRAVLQDGDQVFMLVTDDMIDPVTKITGSAPEGGH